jgi:hypothetical protein
MLLHPYQQLHAPYVPVRKFHAWAASHEGLRLKTAAPRRRQAARNPGDNPGFEERYRLERTRSGELVKCFGDPCLEGLRGCECDFLGQRCEFLGLLGQRLELLA